MTFYKGDCTLWERKQMDFQGLLDTGSEFVQIPKHPKKHCGPLF